MTFEPMPQVVPGLDVWGAYRDGYTFMVSVDHQNDDEVRASVKAAGTTPFDGTRYDLGVFNSLQEALEACRAWKPV